MEQLRVNVRNVQHLLAGLCENTKHLLPDHYYFISSYHLVGPSSQELTLKQILKKND